MKQFKVYQSPVGGLDTFKQWYQYQGTFLAKNPCVLGAQHMRVDFSTPE